jgi:hypothetical protein
VSATLSFSPTAINVANTTTQSITLNLSGPAGTGGVTVNLSSDNPSVATVPAQATFAAGSNSTTVPVTGVSVGSATIHASAMPSIPDTSASVNVVNGIILPANLIVQPSQTLDYPVSLSTPAGPGGVFVFLTVSDPTIASLSSTTVSIPAGQTTPSS